MTDLPLALLRIGKTIADRPTAPTSKQEMFLDLDTASIYAPTDNMTWALIASGLATNTLDDLSDVNTTGQSARDFLVYDGSTTWVVQKNNFAASIAPTTSDDDSSGYAIGSIWIDISSDVIYQCLDASTGAATWRVIGNSVLDNFSEMIAGSGYNFRYNEAGTDIIRVRNDYSASSDPTVNDDSDDGFQKGSIWINSVTDAIHIIADTTVGSALWRIIGGNIFDELAALTPADGNTIRWDGSLNLETVQNKFFQTVAPSINDDITQGWSIGGFWYDITNDIVYTIVDTTTGAAVWLQLSNAIIIDPTGVSDKDYLYYDNAGGDWVVLKNNYAGTVPPTTSNDVTQGYAQGSLWFDTVSSNIYQCINASTGAAIWKDISGAGSGDNNWQTQSNSIASESILATEQISIWGSLEVSGVLTNDGAVYINDPDTGDTATYKPDNIQLVALNAEHVVPAGQAGLFARPNGLWFGQDENDVITPLSLEGTGHFEITGYTELSSAASSIDLIDIPQFFLALRLKLQLRSDRAGDLDNALMRFNGQTLAQFYYSVQGGHYNNSGSPNNYVVSNYANASGLGVALVSANTTTSGYFSMIDMWIWNYSNPNLNSYFTNNAFTPRTANWLYDTMTFGTYRSKDPISSISIFPETGLNWVANCSYQLFGYSLYNEEDE